MHIKKWVILILQILICITFLASQINGEEENKKVVITGTLKYPSGKSVANYIVRLTEIEQDSPKAAIKIRDNKVTNLSAKTDKNGRFRIDINYNISTKKKKYLLSRSRDKKGVRLKPLEVEGKPLILDIPQGKDRIDIGTVVLQ